MKWIRIFLVVSLLQGSSTLAGPLYRVVTTEETRTTETNLGVDRRSLDYVRIRGRIAFTGDTTQEAITGRAWPSFTVGAGDGMPLARASLLAPFELTLRVPPGATRPALWARNQQDGVAVRERPDRRALLRGRRHAITGLARPRRVSPGTSR